MRRLTETLGMPGNASVLTREGSELQVALTTMCSLRESIEAMWDLTVGEEDASLTLLRSMVQLLLQPTCKWVSRDTALQKQKQIPKAWLYGLSA